MTFRYLHLWLRQIKLN